MKDPEKIICLVAVIKSALTTLVTLFQMQSILLLQLQSYQKKLRSAIENATTERNTALVRYRRSRQR